MIIIPAIDLIDGQCVRLKYGDYQQKTIYERDPLEMARRFEEHGLQRLHLVDLDGARAGRIVNSDVLKRITTETTLTVDFSGGIRTTEHLTTAFECGASMVPIGSVAVKNQALFVNWLQTYGAKRIILSADVKNGQIAVSGWQENSGRSLRDFIRDYAQVGVKTVFCTDISRDGALQGPSLDLYRDLLSEFPWIQWVASGGVSSVKDVERLAAVGVHGVIIGKAIYEGAIDLADLAKFRDERL